MKTEWKPYLKSIAALALPIMIENTLQTLLGTTDTYFAGRLSDDAIAAIGVTNLVMNLFLSFFTAVSVGACAVVSRNYGKRDYSRVSRSVVHSLVLGLGLGLATGMICALFRRPVLRISGADDAIIEYAMPYYLSVAVPCAALCLQLILSSCLRAMKDTKTPMYVTGASNLLNIFLNILFIRAGLGILGLGLATTLSRGISACALFTRLRKRGSDLFVQKSEKAGDSMAADSSFHLTACLKAREFSSILKIGLPAGMEKIIMRVGQLIYNGMILSIGTSSYVAHNIAGNIESYSYIPAMGLGLAVCTITGVSLGENNRLKARKTTAAACILGSVFALLFGFVFFVFAPQLTAVFSDTKEVQDMASSVLRIIALFQPFGFLVQIMTNALQGAGDTRFPMYSTFLGIWGIRIGIGWLLAVHFHMGLDGIWYAYALDVTVRGILLLIRFQSGKWQKINL